MENLILYKVCGGMPVSVSYVYFPFISKTFIAYNRNSPQDLLYSTDQMHLNCTHSTRDGHYFSLKLRKQNQSQLIQVLFSLQNNFNIIQNIFVDGILDSEVVFECMNSPNSPLVLGEGKDLTNFFNKAEGDPRDDN